MAFDLTTFGPIGGQASRGKAPQMFTYTSTDTAATVNTAGYFNDVSTSLEVGDFIIAYLDTGGTPQGYIFNVNANASGVVDVTDGLAIGTADLD